MQCYRRKLLTEVDIHIKAAKDASWEKSDSKMPFSSCYKSKIIQWPKAAFGNTITLQNFCSSLARSCWIHGQVQVRNE